MRVRDMGEEGVFVRDAGLHDEARASAAPAATLRAPPPNVTPSQLVCVCLSLSVLECAREREGGRKGEREGGRERELEAGRGAPVREEGGGGQSHRRSPTLSQGAHTSSASSCRYVC